ncbi:MAG: TonB-dependent receptor [Pseudomonadales bacterium]|nr:TonB-dependent receptor [Pseudomonadales bacterium]
MNCKRLAGSFGVAGALLWAAAAQAAVIEEVVVVAQKRSQSVQEVPISITAFSGEDLEARGLNDLQRLATFVPNFDLPGSNNTRNSQVRIRGIGTTGTNPGIESSVGVFLDGLYMPTGAMSLGELADISTVEILRGPQGTLYGRNTPVGAVNINTRRPEHEFDAMIRGGIGAYGGRVVNGFVGGGLSDRVAGRLTFYHREFDGYLRNALLGGRVNDNDEQGVRGRLLFAPTDALEINLTAYWSKQEKRCCVGEQIDPLGPSGIATPGFLAAAEAIGKPFRNFDDKDHVVWADDEGDDQVDSWGAALQADWDVGNGHTITSITGFQDWDNLVAISSESTPQAVLLSVQNQVNEVLSQELRLTSPTGEAWEYIAGLYYYAQDTTFFTSSTALSDANRVFPLPAAVCPAPCRMVPGSTAFQDFTQETRSVAAFGSLTRYLTEQWDVTAGLRYSMDDKDVDIAHYNAPGAAPPFTNVFGTNIIGPQQRSDRNATWSVNSRYRFTDNLMGFVTVGTGFKSGGFNATRVSVGTPVEFEDEESISYEAGIKSTWLDQRLQLNATAYWTVLTDFQDTSLNLQTGTGFIVANAGEQRNRGFEADLLFRPRGELTLNAAVALLDSEYTDYPNAQCGVGEAPTGPGGTCDRKGETPAMAPTWKYSLGAEWAQPLTGTNLEWSVRADYAWVDDQNLIRVTVDPPGDQSAYGLLNFRAGLGAQDGSWDISAFADNVNNEAYYIQVAGQPVAALMSGGGTAPARGFLGWYGPPRMWGLQATWRPGAR